MLELALVIFRNSLDAPALCEDGRRICAQALGMVDGLLRPVVPPLVKSMALRQATRDLTGGSVLGKEADYIDIREQSTHLDLHEAEAVQSAQNQTEKEWRQQESVSTERSRQQDHSIVQPIVIPSSAAPSAQDVSMSSFGLPITREIDNSLASESISAHATSGPLDEPPVKSAHITPPLEPAVSSLANHSTSGASSADLRKSNDPELDEQEEEPPLVAGGGRQAELAAVTWGAEDSETSDDDAPMPKIYMTDDEDD